MTSNRIRAKTIVFALIAVLAVAQAFAADRVAGADRLASALFGAELSAAALAPAADGDSYLTGGYGDAFRLENQSQSIVLKPIRSANSAGRSNRGRAIYTDAFRGVDATRFSAGRRGEVLVVRDAAAARAIDYEVLSMDGTAVVGRDGRGVRFSAATSREDIRLSAPLVIDANGQPSLRARWVVRESGSGAPILHLDVDDRGLAYPLAVAYTVGALDVASALRNGRVAVDGTGAISGVVTNASGQGVSSALILVFDRSGEFVTADTSISTGAYLIAGLDTGVYSVAVTADGYASELYDNIPCPDLDCGIATGTAVSVTDGSTTANINFSLVSSVATVSGSVTNDSGAPLPGVVVLLVDAANDVYGFGDVLADGTYSITPYTTGTYYARTLNSLYEGYVDQLYSGVDCTGCDPTTGTALNVSPGTVSSSVNFALKANGGRIAGRVADTAGTGLANATVRFFNSAGQYVSVGKVDGNGNYISLHGLTSGTYYVEAHVRGYTSELYDNIACTAGCPAATTGTGVSVTLGSTTQNINFTLGNDEAFVSGFVKDQSTSAPLGAVAVLFYDSTGTLIRIAYSDFDTGAYSVALPGTGTYYARTVNRYHAGYIDQLYSNIDCSGCDPLTGTPINASTATALTGINFLMNGGGRIQGSVTDSTLTPVPYPYIQVYNGTGKLVGSASGDANGSFITGNALAAGTYYLLVYADGYSVQLYQNIACPTGCDVTTGTGVVVTNGQNTTVSITVASALGHITGRVTAAATGAGLGGVEVQIYNANGDQVSSAATDGDGNYDAALFATGTYYAVTNNSAHPQYADQLYNGLACNGCDPTTGTAISATVGGVTSSINFALPNQICNAIAFSPNTLPDAVLNAPYSRTVVASNGTAPYSYARTGTDPLPPGLSLDGSTGVISGTPTALGTYPFTITATDANNCTGAHTYSITVTNVSTTTTLTATPASPVFGSSFTLTASINPSTATGFVTFFEGANALSTEELSGGSASLVVTRNAGTYSYTASYLGAPGYPPSTSAAVSVVVQKATPVITWADPAPIEYSTPLSGTQLNATANVAGSFSYSPAAGTILDAGSHALTATFTPSDSGNYATATKTVSILVNKSSQQVITWSNPADIVYGTPLSATQLNATVTVPGPAPAGALTYVPPAGTILDAGTHTLSVTAAETANYGSSSKGVTIVVLKATPVFSDLSAPTIVLGTASATISGKLAAGSLIPPGNVSITLNGVTQTAAIQADGTFSSTFATSALTVGSRTVSFSYAGSTNYNAASGSTTLIVTYGFLGGPLGNQPSNVGSTIPFRIRLTNAAGGNVSSQSIAVTAYGVRLTSSNTWLPAVSNGNQGLGFDFKNAQGGSYDFTLKTTGLAAGDYVLGYTVAGDPVIHTIPFAIR